MPSVYQERYMFLMIFPSFKYLLLIFLSLSNICCHLLDVWILFLTVYCYPHSVTRTERAVMQKKRKTWQMLSTPVSYIHVQREETNKKLLNCKSLWTLKIRGIQCHKKKINCISETSIIYAAEAVHPPPNDIDIWQNILNSLTQIFFSETNMIFRKSRLPSTKWY